ncbi:MAG: hypothetical protein U0269_32130 [Polyangiales bacterium]
MVQRAFATVTLDALAIDDEEAFEHMALYAPLARVVREDALTFRVAPAGSAQATWARALFLNLTFWHGDDTSDVLRERRIPADVVAHCAWHHLAKGALVTESSSAEAMLLGESIASAFDLFMLGTLLAAGQDCDFLASQMQAITSSLEDVGYDERDAEARFERMALDPAGSFESLRALLFDVTTALLEARSLDAATAVFDRFESHPDAPLLHHYELSNWVLHCKAYAAPDPESARRAREVHAALREAPSSIEWLEARWLAPAIARLDRARSSLPG